MKKKVEQKKLLLVAFYLLSVFKAQPFYNKIFRQHFFLLLFSEAYGCRYNNKVPFKKKKIVLNSSFDE